MAILREGLNYKAIAVMVGVPLLAVSGIWWGYRLRMRDEGSLLRQDISRHSQLLASLEAQRNRADAASAQLAQVRAQNQELTAQAQAQQTPVSSPQNSKAILSALAGTLVGGGGVYLYYEYQRRQRNKELEEMRIASEEI